MCKKRRRTRLNSNNVNSIFILKFCPLISMLQFGLDNFRQEEIISKPNKCSILNKTFKTSFKKCPPCCFCSYVIETTYNVAILTNADES